MTRKYKILIVDDNKVNLQVISQIFRETEYGIALATDGETALEIISMDDYDLVLLDIMMPGMDGYEVCKKIREKLMLQIPIIFLTAKTEDEDLFKGFECGGNDYVTKPFNKRELLLRVDTHVELYNSKKQLKVLNQSLEKKVLERTKALENSNLELRKANQKLQILDEAKMEFLKIISHELRTPLNGIRGFSELIALKCKSDETDHLLNRLFDSIDSLYDFSTMALDITSLRLNKYKINPEVYDIREDIDSALEGIHEFVREKNITFRKENLENVIEISGEKDLIKRAVKILLENAVKHTAENSNINIRYLKDDHSHLFSILDNGPGFHESILKSDLSAFNTGNKHLNKNMGLDLPFANLVFLGHNGHLKIDNHPEGGAMVQFSLPVAVN